MPYLFILSFLHLIGGFKYALDFLGKKSSMPPLGLLTY